MSCQSRLKILNVYIQKMTILTSYVCVAILTSYVCVAIDSMLLPIFYIRLAVLFMPPFVHP